MSDDYISWPHILYGGDYNPEQWPESVREEDSHLMERANWNIATLPVFGWVSLEPEEGRYTFEWLDHVLDDLANHGVSACLATATASVPAWVDQKYPDILTADDKGARRRHGNRHTFCPTSPNFRRLSTNLARRMAERYKDHPSLMLWHIGNEYGTYCWCENCAAAFRAWLEARYGSLDALNRRWYTSFWGHTYTDWSQIEPPYANGERSIQALQIDWRRFQSDSLLACCAAEAAVLREVTPGVPITTNMMGPFSPLDYHKWAKVLDVVSWDNYPGPDSPPSDIAFNHALMRGLKEGKPFLLMEQSPSQQNWQPYNRLKPPGQLRLQSFQAMAHGADSVMYFQWRRGRGGIEKLHGAVMEHGGTPENRVFKEVAALGAELKALGTQTIGGRVPARVALLFSWENWWALQASSGPSKDLDYLKVCRAFHAALHGLGIQTDILSPDADLSHYDVIVAPLLYMITPEQANRIRQRVKDGASLVATFFSFMVDDCDTVYLEGAPGPLHDVLGIHVEETDAIEGEWNGEIRVTDARTGMDIGEAVRAGLLADRINLRGAETLATYDGIRFYAGEPCATVNAFGNGKGYYLATLPDTYVIRRLLLAICKELDISPPFMDDGFPAGVVESSIRISPDGTELLYLLQHGSPATVVLPRAEYEDILTGDRFSEAVRMKERDVKILRRIGASANPH